MKNISIGRMVAVAAVAALAPAAVWIVGAKACGPDFEPEVFVPRHRPEAPKLYATGNLGVVQGTYYHADLIVAYRYLSGGVLSAAEQAAYAQAGSFTGDDGYGDWDESRNVAATAAMNGWLHARASVAPGADSPAVSETRTVDERIGSYTFHGEELNCTDSAFSTSAATLAARAEMWGASSANVKNWLRGQDAVFSNCAATGTMPEGADAGWPALLRQDRAYQIAAAEFYAGRFDDAIAAFDAIGRDKASPWSRWGAYLSARAEVRKASYSGKAADFGEKADFDQTILRAAETKLRDLLAATRDTEIRHAAQAELNFIAVRLEPEQRLAEAGNALAGPKPDPEFAQDAIDLDWLIKAHPAAASDLVQWITAMRGVSAKGTPEEQAILKHEQQNLDKLPWLVAALTHAAAGSGEEEMVRAAAAVPVGSPGYQTASFYRAGTMIASGRNDEARALTSSILAGLHGEGTNAARNEFLSLRIETSRNLSDFLADAPRTLMKSQMDSESAAAYMARCAGRASSMEECRTPIPPLQFDEDAAAYMDREMPLAMLEEAAESKALPSYLREAVAEVAWVRALGLGDTAAVQRMAPLLPERIRAVAGTSSGFPATLALLRSPGLKPYLLSGVQRSVSFSEMDHFRDNWWCGQWTDGGGVPDYTGSGLPVQQAELAFLSPQERRRAAEQGARLNANATGLVWAAQRAIAYVKAHPNDKDAPEALALVVDGTHWGCDLGQRVTVDPARHTTAYSYATAYPQRAVSKEAFEMLHQMYPKSAWAAKTKYYY